VVSALNRMIDDVDAGRAVFYEVYSAEDRKRDPAKSNTGLFFLRGKPGAPFAAISPGGGLSCVGSVHEGFPYAAAISRHGHGVALVRTDLLQPPPRSASTVA
jgi:hypothetical protein